MTEAAGKQRGRSLFVMVGDLSGDKHVAKLLLKLKEMAPDLHAWGTGGPAMKEAGFETMHNCQDFAVLGIFEVIRQAPFLRRLHVQMIRELSNRTPDAVLLVDNGGFNLGLASDIRKRFPSLPILYFISPQVWGSRPWRINVIAATVTKMLVIFPFEEALYKARGIQVRFVGHPLTTNLPSPETLPTREAFGASIGIDPSQHIVAVFPGSRKREIADLMPITLNSMQYLIETRKDVQFVISQGNTVLAELIKSAIEAHGFSEEQARRVYLVDSQVNYELMANADVVWAKSGTTALEVTLFGKPMIIYYRVIWLTYLLFLIFKRVKRVGWRNLLSGENLVPELIQLDCRAELLVRYTNDLLDVPALRKEIREKLLALRSALGQGDYATNCADEILQTIAPNLSVQELPQANV